MDKNISKPTDASIILTYRCPMQCKMCNIWKNPTDKHKELKAEELRSLPKLKFINLTGGEPFVREDLEEIVDVCYTKTDRIVISTSGWFDDRVIALAKKYPQIGIRISIEGLSQKNDDLRGRQGGFDKGLRTLLKLREMGVKDIGFGCTVSNYNSKDMLSLYSLSRSLGMEFATASFHNSYYHLQRPSKIYSSIGFGNKRIFKSDKIENTIEAYRRYRLASVFLHFRFSMISDT